MLPALGVNVVDWKTPAGDWSGSSWATKEDVVR